MSPTVIRKLRFLGEFCLLGAIAGIFYQLIDDGFADHMVIIIGVVLGLGFWIIELFVAMVFSMWHYEMKRVNGKSH